MARDSYIQAAFEQVCSEAKQAKGFYVCLMEKTSRYGGPEEGGWWTHDTHVVAYQYFETEEAAEAAKEAVEKLSVNMNQDAKRRFGEQCLREMEFCDARGMDYDELPEVDGENEYYVLVSEGLPEPSYGPTHYE